jgi:hypothetical protein
MFFTVGPSCLSTDAIFKAIENKRQLEEWKERVKKRKGILEEKTAQDKGREAAAKERNNKRGLRTDADVEDGHIKVQG